MSRGPVLLRRVAWAASPHRDCGPDHEKSLRWIAHWNACAFQSEVSVT